MRIFIYIFSVVINPPDNFLSIHINIYFGSCFLTAIPVSVGFFISNKTPVYRSLDFSRLKIAKMKLVDDEKLTSEPSHSYGMMMMMSVQEED